MRNFKIIAHYFALKVISTTARFRDKIDTCKVGIKGMHI